MKQSNLDRITIELTVGVALRGHPSFDIAFVVKRVATEGHPYS